MATTAGSDAVLPADLVELLQSGVSILVGTRDAALRPEALRGVGCIVGGDRRSLVVLLNEITARRTAANVQAGSPVAVTFNRPIDHRSLQIKGRARAVRAATAAELEVARAYLGRFSEHLYAIGISYAFTRRLRVEPTTAVELDIDELFEQTPGPGAGRRFGAPA